MQPSETSRQQGILWVLRGNSRQQVERASETADSFTSHPVLADFVHPAGVDDSSFSRHHDPPNAANNRCEVKASIEMNLIRSVRDAIEADICNLDEGSKFCSICLEEMKFTDTVVTTCGHVFHRKCFEHSERCLLPCLT